MKSHLSWATLGSTSALFALLAISCPTSNGQDEEVRNWRSTSGKSIKGTLIGVKDGKAIIRPPVKAVEAPLAKLSREDRRYIEEWQKAEASRLAAAEKARMALINSMPLVQTLRGNCSILDEKTVRKHKFNDLGKLKYGLIYITDHRQADDADDLNQLYRKLKKRYDNFEMLYVTSEKDKDSWQAFMKENELTFPSLDFEFIRTKSGGPLVSKLRTRGVIPQIVLVDLKGEILSDSYVGDDKGSRQALKEPLEELQTILRADARDAKKAAKE